MGLEKQKAEVLEEDEIDSLHSVLFTFIGKLSLFINLCKKALFAL
jgi:hypothetical protein